MIDLNADEIFYFLSALRKIKILKAFESMKIQVSETDITVDEDMAYDQTDFLVLLIQAAGFDVETEIADDSSGKSKGYELLYDPEEVSYFEIIIKHKELNEYLSWAKKNKIKIRNLSITNDCFNLVKYYSHNDYCDCDSFLAEDYTGICILENITDFLDLGFFTDLFSIIEVCKVKNAEHKQKTRYARKLRRRCYGLTA